MMEGEEMEGLNIDDYQGNNDPAHQGPASSGPSVTRNSDGDGLMFSKRCVIIGGIISGAVVIGLIISIFLNIVQGVMLQHYQADLGPSDVSSCSQDWIKEGGVAYFFSEEEGDWSSSQNFCSSCGGSLVAIENTQEMDFIIKNKHPAEYWVGLQREKVQQPWKRLNGSVFNNWCPIHGEGLCAYLSYQGISSTWCTNSRYWICKKILLGS